MVCQLTAFDRDHALEARLDALCAEGWALFEEFDLRVRDREFHPFVAADYEAVRAALIVIVRPARDSWSSVRRPA